jgi:hypothetical protein
MGKYASKIRDYVVGPPSDPWKSDGQRKVGRKRARAQKFRESSGREVREGLCLRDPRGGG